MQPERSIRSRLKFLVIGVALPLVLLAAYASWTDFNSTRRLAEQQSDRLASVVSASVSRYVADVITIAVQLGGNPDVQSLDPERCRRSLEPVANALPHVPNLFLGRADGTLVCSVIPFPDLNDLSGRPEIRAAIESKEVTFGPPIEAPISGTMVVPVIVPIRDDDHRLVGVLVVPLGLAAMQSLVVEEPQSGRLVTITDTSFVVVARSLDPEEWIGKRLPTASPEDLADISTGEGYNTADGADGIRRLFRYQRIEGTPWVVWAGIPTSQIYAPVRAPLYPKLGLAALTLLFVLLYSRTVNRQIQSSLSGLSADMRAAESTRTGLVKESGPEEIADVARQFNRQLLDRRRAESSAAASADLHDLVSRATNDALWDWDLETGRIGGNLRFTTMLGIETDTVLGGEDFWERYVHADDHAKMKVRNSDLLESRVDSVSSEFRLRKADNSWAEVLERCHAVHDENGRPVRLVGMMTDVSLTRAAQRRTERATARYRAVLKNAPMAIYIARSNGSLIDANPAFLTMFGVDQEEALALTEADFFFDQDDAGSPASKGPTSKDAPQETQWKTPGGRVIDIRFFRSEVVDETGEAHVEVMAEDLTEQNKLGEQIRQAQRIDAMGQLAGGVAHDFNNRLTVIQGRAELLKHEVRHDPDLVDGVDAILESAAGVAKVTSELLAVSRKQMFRPRVLSINPMVEQLKPTVEAALGENYSLELELTEGLPLVSVDPGHLQQIVINVMLNARDALPAGGRIVLRTTHRVVAPQESEVTAGLSEGSYVVLTMSDTGVGMPADVAERVFEPFFTTKPVGLGTGLGLATVYGLAKQNGGFVSVRSEAGRGTDIDLLLPATPMTSAQRPREPVGPVPRGEGETVLVVEDEARVRSVIASSLSMLGYEVLQAESAEEALALPDDTWRRVDAVVTDVVMGGLRGTALAESLRDRYPHLPVLLVSGYRDDEETLEIIAQPGRAFLSKPFSPQTLGISLARLLATTRAEITSN